MALAGAGRLFESLLSKSGSSLLDERGLLERVFELELAARVFPETKTEDPQDIVRDVMYGQRLPAVKYVIGPGLWASFQDQITAFSNQLETLVDGSYKARLRIMKSMEGTPQGFGLVPIYSRSGKGLHVRYRVIADTLKGVLTYSLGLLLDQDQGFSDLLSRCELPECRKFFFAQQSEGGGRPRRRYCTEGHMDMAHNRDAKRRVAEYRARKRAGTHK